MNIQTPLPGSPSPNNPKRNTHAPIAISITFLIPKRLKKKGINKIQQVSLICEIEISKLACCTPKVSAYSGSALKLVMKGLANPLVIWRDTPSNMEKTKNIAILLFLNSRKARRPNASTSDFFSPASRFTGQSGKVLA